MRAILTFTLISLLASFTVRAQMCQVTASASVNAVCLGRPVTISATAHATLPSNQFFDFNQNQLPQGWATTGGTNYSATICGQSPDHTPYFWASTAVGTPQIVTADFDVCSGGYIEFQMRYAIQGGASPCEGPDERGEGVSLEYSLNGGVTWVEFRYFQPDGQILPANPGGSTVVATGNTPFTVWATYNIPIPAAAVGTHTRFRWVQRNSSGACCDNWGLDNIGIYAGPCLATNLEWSNGMSGIDHFTFSPTRDTCFTASLYDDNNVFLCSDNVCITVNPNFTSNTNVTICAGQTYMFGPTSSALLPYTTTGNYPATFTAVTGCDSVVTLHLTVTPPTNDTADVTVCYGASYTLGTTTYNTAGTYTQTLTGVAGCDSIVTVNLTIAPQLTSSFSTSICNGDTYVLGTQSLTTTGTYQEIFRAATGCDSTVTLNLTVNPTYTGRIDTALCAGVTYTLGTQTFNGAGVYPVLFRTVNGCDSLITLGITIMPAPVPVAGNDLVLCSDAVGQLGGAPVSGISYSWHGAAGISNDTISDPTVSIHTSTPQIITYVVTAYYQGCVASDSVDVTWVPYPVINIPPVAPQCLDGNLFTFSPGNGFLPGAAFSWNLGNAAPSGGNTHTVNNVHFLASGMHPATVSVSHGTCTSRDTLWVQVHAEPKASLVPLPGNGCIPLTVQFQNTSTPAAVSSEWIFGNGQTSTASNPAALYTQVGSYTVLLVVTTPEGCRDSAEYPGLITTFPLPQAGFSAHPYTVFQDDPYIQVTDNSIGASSWMYTVSSGGYHTTANFAHHFYDTGYHYIHQVVTNIYGCTDEHDETIHVLPGTMIYIPNAFTPGNHDGINQLFGAYGNYISDFRMTIFDRWGMKVFSSEDIEERWDGTIKGRLLKEDVYVYKISYLNHRKEIKEEMGHVTLIR